jgi:hypothetical protein
MIAVYCLSLVSENRTAGYSGLYRLLIFYVLCIISKLEVDTSKDDFSVITWIPQIR